jgi:exosortase F-associated protein
MISQKHIRLATGILSLSGLIVIFLFQGVDLAGKMNITNDSLHSFLVNRTIRFILNDFFAIGLIYALFGLRKYVVFSVWVQLAGMVFFLFPYFVLKLYFPSYNGPLISFLHRLILNPILLLLLIPAFYYQQKLAGKQS